MYTHFKSRKGENVFLRIVHENWSGFLLDGRQVEDPLAVFHSIEAHIDVVVNFLDIKSIASFHIGIDEDFVGFWGTNLMFQSPHTTNFLIFINF